MTDTTCLSTTGSLSFGTAGFSAAAGSHRGRRRETNEDRYELDPQAGFMLVVDGIGGNAAGEVAAALAAGAIRRCMRRPHETPEEGVREAILLANQHIFERRLAMKTRLFMLLRWRRLPEHNRQAHLLSSCVISTVEAKAIELRQYINFDPTPKGPQKIRLLCGFGALISLKGQERTMNIRRSVVTFLLIWIASAISVAEAMPCRFSVTSR